MNKCCLAAYHMHSNKDPEGFEQFLKHPYKTVFLLEMKNKPEKDDKVFDDLKRCREHRKHAFVMFWNLIFEEKDAPYHRPLKPNWKELLDELNERLCEIGGEYFLGYHFDEPFYYMTGDEYLELTKYMSKYGKRISAVHASVHIHMALWPVNESHDFQSVAFRNMSHITPENHAYTTDVSYDYYGKWEHGVHHNTIYRMFIERMGDRFEKTKFWFTPPVGTTLAEWIYEPDHGEQTCIDVFMGMWNWAKKIKNFGGFMVYGYYNWVRKRDGMSDGNGRHYLMPDENGNIEWKRLHMLLEAVGKGFNEGKTPAEIELPEVEYDKGYIV